MKRVLLDNLCDMEINEVGDPNDLVHYYSLQLYNLDGPYSRR